MLKVLCLLELFPDVAIWPLPIALGLNSTRYKMSSLCCYACFRIIVKSALGFQGHPLTEGAFQWLCRVPDFHSGSAAVLGGGEKAQPKTTLVGDLWKCSEFC